MFYQINSDLPVNILGEQVKAILNSEFTFNFTDGVATKDMSQFLESGYHFAKACFVTHSAGTYFVLNSASINPATNTLTVRASAIGAQTGVVGKFNGTAVLAVLFFLTRN